MAAYYLAVDIGASSGRHIIGHMENGKMVLEEIYRFENGMVKKDGELCWEFERLFKEVVNGLKKCKEIGKIPVSMGVDTWGTRPPMESNTPSCGSQVLHVDSAILTVLIPAFFIIATSCCRRSYGIYSS